MRGKILPLMLLTIFASIGLVMGLTGSCTSQSDYNELVCGNTPNSASGYGAAEICGNCYPCGQADGVCPEDFFSTVTQTQGNCRLCPDPDCPASIYGTVIEGGMPVPNADIYAVFNSNNNVDEVMLINRTNDTGDYSGTIYSGFHTLFVQYASFRSPNQELEIRRGENKEFNFTINRGTCNEDCTIGTTGVCSSTCHNKEGCVYQTEYGFTPETVALACDGLERDDWAPLGTVGGEVVRAVCCRADNFETNTQIQAQATAKEDAKIENSATWETPVTYRSEPMTLKVSIGA